MLFERWESAYVLTIASLIGLLGTALLAVAVSRAPRVSRLRLAVAGGTVVGTAAWAAAMRTGVANVDVVEAFHLVEYSALAFLLVWVFSPLASGLAWAWAGVAAVWVGTIDEWYQWFVPGRTGEIRDVGMNVVAVACGLGVAGALGWGRGRGTVAPGPLRVLGAGAALLATTVAAFLASVHIGHVVRDAEVGEFRSVASAAELLAASAERARRWGSRPVPTPSRFGREDQFLSEALWHVRRRNDAVAHGPAVEAWQEQRILEKYFAPVLAVTTPDGPRGHALAPDRRAALRAWADRVASRASRANPVPIFAVPRATFWAWACVGALGVLGLAEVAVRRRAAARPGG